MLGLLPGLLAAAPSAAAPVPWGQWPQWGDQGDGTYRNPVLPADYSDLDCIRVGAEYFAISSTFQFSPGIIILRSADLVNWTIVGHAVPDLTAIGPELNWDRMNRSGKGIWAGALRHHEGRFWIYFGTPDEGYFLTSAPKVEGPWSEPHCLLAGPGWDDPCPFWDTDGQAYLVGSHFRDGYKIHLWRLSENGQELLLASDRVIHQSKGSEANKLYHINGVYYHLFSEVRPEGRVVMMERAANITGPYEESRQLNHADPAAKEPNQGGLVQTETGEWYFLTHHGKGDWEGRCASLLPVNWVDGWPMIGDVGSDGIGTMVWAGKMPVAGRGIQVPATSDEFSTATIAPQWEWNYQPRADRWSLTERTGWLRLHAFRPLLPGDLARAGNTLTQRSFRAANNQAVLKLQVDSMADGGQAGLCHFAKTYARIGIQQERGLKRVIALVAGQPWSGPEVPGKFVWLKSSWGLDGQNQFSFSLDGEHFQDLGPVNPLSWGNYRGDRIGIYHFNDQGERGFVDADYFHYDFSGPAERHGGGNGGAAPSRFLRSHHGGLSSLKI